MIVGQLIKGPPYAPYMVPPPGGSVIITGGPLPYPPHI